MKIVKISKVGKMPVYDLSVDQAEHYVLSNGVVTHNTGITYCCNNIFIVTKAQEKKGTDVIGYNFNINVSKSRMSREKSKIPVTVTYEGGVNKWSGLLDMAVASSDVIKPSMGWYSRVDEDGVVEDKKWRAADTNNAEFWDPILKKKHFREWVENTFKIANKPLMDDGSEPESPSEFTSDEV